LGAVDVGGDTPVDAAVGPVVVVEVDERVEEVLELSDRVGFGSGCEPFLEGLVEPFDFPAGLGVERSAVGGVDLEVLRGCW
jgi:hypothetical protein